MDAEEFAKMISVPFRMVVASKSNSGKTVLMTQLVKELVKLKKIYVPFISFPTRSGSARTGSSSLPTSSQNSVPSGSKR